MKLENRIPAEGINASHENPLKEFAWLIAGSVVVLVALVALIGWGAGWIAPRIPYRYEAKLTAGLDLAKPPESEAARAAQAELQALADRLLGRMTLPKGMSVRVGYRDDRTVNAFATVGGQTVFFRGLIGKLDNENALAMVLAHEIAHLKYRHPAAALGRGLGVGIMLSVVSADLGQSAAGGVLSQAGVATLFAFNREQEREADEEALRVIAAEYGHVGGALDLFETFLQLPAESRSAGSPAIEFMRTHPLTASRVEAVRAWAAANGVALDGARTPLTPALAGVRSAGSGPK